MIFDRMGLRKSTAAGKCAPDQRNAKLPLVFVNSWYPRYITPYVIKELNRLTAFLLIKSVIC